MTLTQGRDGTMMNMDAKRRGERRRASKENTVPCTASSLSVMLKILEENINIECSVSV